MPRFTPYDGRRDAPEDQTRDFSTRNLALRAETVNEEGRTVEATLSTDARVEVLDWRRGEAVEEILLTEGVELPRRLPLLNTHSRYSLDDVLGSVTEIRTAAGEPAAISGRLEFAAGDEIADRVWNKVRQGHLTDVSVGYRVTAATEVNPGETATINGKQYTAGRLRLRIATAWTLREVSVVPIGADQNAKTREDSITQTRGVSIMPPELRAYLESIGLRAEATDAEAWQFLAGLDGEQRSAANQLLTGQQQPTQDASRGDDGDEDQARGADDGDAAQRAIREERDRVRTIRQLAGSDVPADIATRAIDEGWTVDQASREFLQAVRGQRMRQAGQAPAGHSHSHEAACNVRTLAAGMLIASGRDPIGVSLHDGNRAVHSERLSERDADLGDEFRSLSSVDLVRECARMDTGRLIRDPGEAFRAAVSGTSLDRVFTTNAYAQLLAGWEEEMDSTDWCQVEDVPNFLEQEDITLNAQAALDKHPRGKTANHATAEDDHETYKIARYAKQFVADEQDVIDDRLGALMQMPFEMGQAARRLRPDLVYSLLLANGALAATGGALFNSTAETTSGGHANLGSAALAAAGLKAAIAAMKKRRLGTGKQAKTLNIRPRFLIVPPDLEFTALELVTSARVNHTGDTDAAFPDLNVLSRQGLQVVPESRIDAVGVTDPSTGTAYTGSATNWFLAAARRTVKVAYRRGTNRQPQLRSFTLTQGQWGIGWDINLDIGAVAVDYRGLYKGNS